MARALTLTMEAAQDLLARYGGRSQDMRDALEAELQKWTAKRQTKSKADKEAVALANAYATLGILEEQEAEEKRARAEARRQEEVEAATVEYKTPRRARTRMSDFF